MDSNSVRRMTGGQALAEMLKLAGVGPIFGMGGFQLLPFYDACRRLVLRHLLINDERCGAFAADAYAKITNRPGCVDATLGPGATNLMTGLIDATVTVDDPGAFKAPWSGMIRWQKVNRPITEWACAENNLGYEQAFALQEYPMPVANTPDF